MDPGYTLEGDMLRFVAAFPQAREVELATSFTGWQPLPMALQPDGRFMCVLPAPPPGLHLYKYVVDGAWRTDPTHGDRRPDGLGDFNSALLVGSPELPLGGRGVLRVASLNLHTWQEDDPFAKLEAVASVFDALDIHAAALQEVGQHRHAPERHPNAGELLKRLLETRTGLPWQHEWRVAHIGFDVYDEGVSLLSRLPLRELQEHELGGRTWRRNALSARLDGVPLRLCSVHTSWPGDGGGQEVAALLASLGEGPALVAGDLNAEPHTAPLQALRAAGFEDVGLSFGQRQDTFLGGHGPDGGRIDYHLLRPAAQPWRAQAFVPLFGGGAVLGVAQPRVSDHVGLLGAYLLRAGSDASQGLLVGVRPRS